MSKPKEVSIAFSGAGFLGAYYAGVILCLKRFAPDMNIVSATGASAGALAACCLLSKKPVEEYIAPVLLFCSSIRRFRMGAFSPCCNLDEILTETLHEVLPNDILDDVSGRLHISITRVSDKKNFLISEFSSKQDLIDCLRASSFVPVFSGAIPPIFRGERYMDGMFTDNLPKITDDAITVSPFCSDADISPMLTTDPKCYLKFANNRIALTWDNVKIFWMSAWPQTTETLMDFAEDGFKRTMIYLIINDHIRCGLCKGIDAFKPCEKCHRMRVDYLQKGLPDDTQEMVRNTSQKELEAREKDFIRQTIINTISIILIPLTLPVEFLIALTIFCIPCVIGMYKSIKEYFATNDIVTIVTIALLIPVEICWVVGTLAISRFYHLLRFLEDVVLANMKIRVSSIDCEHVKDRLVTIILIGIIMPMEIVNIVFVYVPHFVVSNLPFLKDAKQRVKNLKCEQSSGSTEEEQQSSLKRATMNDILLE